MKNLMLVQKNGRELLDMQLFPWQQNQWSALLKRREQASLPHALLMTGPAGMGKLTFATCFAHALLCLDPDQTSGHACGQCRACLLLKAETHPDLMLLTAEGKSLTIKIEQIRGVVERLSTTAQQGGYRVVIIDGADTMTVAAANALLKTLEEPGAKTLLMLICQRMSALPATLRSRCQQIVFQPYQPAQQQWLKQQLPDEAKVDGLFELAQGAPLRALALANSAVLETYQSVIKDLLALSTGQLDPISLAQNHHQEDLLLMVDIFVNWTMDLIRIKCYLPQGRVCQWMSESDLNKICLKLKPKSLFNFLDQLLAARNLLVAQSSVQKQLLLETLLIAWVRLFAGRP